MNQSSIAIRLRTTTISQILADMGSLRMVIATSAVAVPVTVTFLDFFGYVAKVEGASMQPVFNPVGQTSSDYVFLNRWKMRTYQFERGEVVSLTAPNNPDTKIIKRIIGLEGDPIRTLGYKQRYTRVPDGHCWVEGDNHGHSMDSNLFGPVPLGLISAKATRIVWPPGRWQRLEVKSDSSRINPKKILPSHLQKMREENGDEDLHELHLTDSD